jgi:hypothetical protein
MEYEAHVSNFETNSEISRRFERWSLRNGMGFLGFFEELDDSSKEVLHKNETTGGDTI